MPSFKVEFSTVRELEKKTSHIFGYTGSSFIIGLFLTAMGIVFIGIPVMVLSGICIILAIIWVSMLGKEPTNKVFCPYCSSPNDVYKSRTEFHCDICKKQVILDDNGQPMLNEPIKVGDKYIQ